jgi:patatin-like phospholipase/acyl hydrolase
VRVKKKSAAKLGGNAGGEALRNIGLKSRGKAPLLCATIPPLPVRFRTKRAGLRPSARANGEGAVKSLKVLAIDGGGIRGIIPAVILTEIQKRIGTDLYKCFDLISGTSTGGIIALGLGTQCNRGQPYAPNELLSLYVEHGPAIFRKNFLTSVRNLLGPKYSPEALQDTLVEFFGDTELKTALTPLLISSYDLQGQIPFFFKSHRIAAQPQYNWPVVSAARATSAAPTFFPPFQLLRGAENYVLVDGGVYVNNPAMAAYAEARSLYPDATDFMIVSAGTGDRQDQIAYEKAKGWGLLGWAKQIVPVFMDSVSEAVDYELKSIPACTYNRLQVESLAPASGAMDDVTPQNLASLQTVARNYLTSVSGHIEAICAELAEGRGSDMPGTGRSSATKG